MSPPRELANRARHAAALGAVAFGLAGCDPPPTSVVLDNGYPVDTAVPLVVYRASWQSVSFPQPVAPGTSSAPQTALPSSDDTAYVLVAPGWDPAGSTPPTSFLLLQSIGGYGVSLGDTVHIPLGDATFIGNCAAQSYLTQAQADFLSQQVFLDDSGAVSFTYDAATCTSTLVGGNGSP
jgi:hypothetical protein